MATRDVHRFARQAFAQTRKTCILAVMSGDRIARALARIETASGRIAAAAPRATGVISRNDSEIARKYAALRGEAEQALAEIDRLIGSLSP